MLSEAQLNANRRNAQYSTGPTSETGKETSSHNAIKFALTGTTFLCPNDRIEDFEKILSDTTNKFFPESDAERHVVREIAIATWRLAKMPFAEAAVKAKGRKDNEKLFQDIEDEYQRAVVREGDVLERCSKTLVNLTLQQNRIQRQLEKKTAEFKEMRKEREVVQNALRDEAMASITHASTRMHETVGFEFSFDYLFARAKFKEWAKTADLSLFDRTWQDKSAKKAT